jgi:actin-like ATPase involved in cell morphogenesis
MVEALRPVKDGIATVAEVTEAMMKYLLEEQQ